MTDPEQDEVFEAYLKRRAVLPALDDKPEPPAALDQRVLNQAREAIQPGATKSPLQRPPRWAVPVALAATILLCLSVVMNISLNTNRRSPNIERMTAARADVKASALSNATAESDAAAGVSARAPARDAFAANNGERRESISGDIPSHEVVLPRAKVAGAPAPHAPVVAEAAAPASPGGASGALADSKRSAAMASANSVAPVPPAEPGGPANATGEANSSSAADKAVVMAKNAGVAAPQYTPAPEQERAAASARKAAAAVAPHPADPKVWLQQIDALRAAGKADQADSEMRRFKAVFPDYGTPSAAPAPSDLPK
jgi:hypothetical protein